MVYELGKNCGVPGGRNHGIAMGNSDIIVCIDNDAVFKDESSLSQVIQQFRVNNRLGVLGFRIENYYTKTISHSDWVYPRALFNRYSDSFLATRFCGAGHAIRRKVFEDVGGYDESLFFYWEELDLSYKIINHGFDIVFYPQVTVLHKVNAEARVNWDDRRYFFLVRNAIYIDWKHFRSVNRLALILMGYFVKGIYNRLAKQTFMGIKEGLRLCVLYDQSPPKLNATAIKYIQDNDLFYRGSFINRVRHEVFEKIR
jgi:GT2 family glycosyltransferase